MPVKAKEAKDIKFAATPKKYNFENDTVYTSYEGLSARKALGLIKPQYILPMVAAEVPEAAILSFLFYYFAVVLPKIGAGVVLPAFVSLLLFYILDVIFGGIVGFSKTFPIRKNGSASMSKMMAMSFSSFSAFTYMLAALALFCLKISNYIFFYIIGAIAIVSYLVTIRFGLAPLLIVARSERTRSQALELSTQYFGGSFGAMLELSLLAILVPAIAIAFVVISGSMLSLAVLFASILVFGAFWQLELNSAFAQFEKIKKISYKIN
ncbi:MAG: hypothetical protein ACP5NE_03105 [Candidatus Micrarchaeia archaeon]